MSNNSTIRINYIRSLTGQPHFVDDLVEGPDFNMDTLDIPAVGKGAIVESDTNSNGSYIRWENGEQICLLSVNLDEQTINRLFSTPLFPASFISAPVSITATINSPGTAGDWDNLTPGVDEVIGPFIRKDTVTVNEFFCFIARIAGGTDFVSGDNADVDAVAWGFWK